MMMMMLSDVADSGWLGAQKAWHWCMCCHLAHCCTATSAYEEFQHPYTDNAGCTACPSEITHTWQRRLLRRSRGQLLQCWRECTLPTLCNLTNNYTLATLQLCTSRPVYCCCSSGQHGLANFLPPQCRAGQSVTPCV
jgi:hypothetical protein